MRLNRFIATATGVSRRRADQFIASGRVKYNGQIASFGIKVDDSDTVQLDGMRLQIERARMTIMLNKPTGYVCSRNGQGSRTIYDLLPERLHNLKPIGRLDKDSSGLLLMSNDGQLSQELTHPRYQKQKFYEVVLDKPLVDVDKMAITHGVMLDDGISSLELSGHGHRWTVTMHEGRNRQIRRTFAHRGYKVTQLHRTQFGTCKLHELATGQYTEIKYS